MRRFTYTAMLLFGILSMMTSCQKEEWQEGMEGTVGRLTARKGALVTRSVPPNSNFEEDTRYRLWAYDAGGKYMFGESAGTENGLLAKESSGKYVEMDSDHAKLLRDKFEVYGFTDGKVYRDDEVVDEEPLEAEGTYDGPIYTVVYNPAIPEGYPDYLRAYLEYDREAGKTASVLEFRHILSRIRVQVIQQGSIIGGKENLTGVFDLKLHSAEIDGVYNNLNYDVRADRFTLPEGTQPKRRTLNKVAEGEPIIPAEAVTAPFSESFILPTLESDKDKPLKLRLVISGDDAMRFSSEKVPGDDGKYIVNVPLHDRINKGEDGNYSLPLIFEPNCSYMLRVVFTEDGIVLFTPMVYPWFDGETEGWEDGEGYEETQIGNTYLFDNLIWSDRNLGAEDYLPASEERFKKCTGFYYEFDRNIPFFPMKNENGILTDNLVERSDVYPVISHPTGRFQNPSQDGGKDNYITRPEDMHLIESGKKAGYYYSENNGFDTGLWKNVATQPVPPGWRLPTAVEFMGIFPSTPHAGNITFLKDLKFYNASNIGEGNSSDFWGDDEVEVMYIHVPNNKEFPNYPADDKYGVSSGPTTGNVLKVAYDPAPGYSSEYVISRAYPDEVGRPEQNIKYDTKWGIIYAIKKVGTDEAYRIRWHVENVVKGKNLYYMVIERFTATATDRLTYKDASAPDYYRNYNWSRPVAILYIPISGMIGDGAWRPGQLGNFGTETILATSDKGSQNNTYKTFRIKIDGDNRKNQFVFASEDRRNNGAQIRLVRESTYQPNR